ncbi:hypothetical protein HWV62_23166 [Athelia sp. TMB]|nr:hypothetical protein HWV62_23166 [Athelia sp. TMB]
MKIPTNQQKWVQVARGRPADVLRLINAPVERPASGSGDILVEVKAVGFNHMYKSMSLIPAFLRKLPAVPEVELSGIVVDPGASSFKEGDEIFGFIPPKPLSSNRGALAQYVLLKEIHATLKPTTLSWETAASLPASGITASRAMFSFDTRPKQDMRVFIAGASTALGRAALQMAKNAGAHVVASCSAGSADGVRALGPDEIVDYTASPLHLQLARGYPYNKSSASPLAFDLIVDCIGADPMVFNHSPSYLRPNGSYVQPGLDSSAGVPVTLWRLACARWWPAWAGGVPRTFKLCGVRIAENESLERELHELAGWAEAGTLRVDVDSVHGFDKAGVMAAYARVMSGRVRGKVIVRVS